MPGYDLTRLKALLIDQVHELGEWFGLETRNKYQILDENKLTIGFAAEQQKGVSGFLWRQFLGHWRKFDVYFFTPDRQLSFIGHHPFRWFFRRIEIKSKTGQFMGAVQMRFSIFTKRFDVQNAQGQVIMEVASPLWKVWTFQFMRRGQEVAVIKKKWSGLLIEALTDKDKFMVEFTSPMLNNDEKNLILASAIFIDLLYFEVKR